jgi:hypothetical protein
MVFSHSLLTTTKFSSMNYINHFIVSALLLLPTYLQAQDSTKRVLPEGTIVVAQLQEDISSGSSEVGDIIRFKTAQAVIVGGDTLVAKGVNITGRITEAAPRRGAGKAGKLSFSIDYLNMPGGKNVKLTGEQKAEGANKTGAAVAQAVLLTPFFLLKKGKDITYQAGQVFNVFVDKDTSL